MTPCKLAIKSYQRSVYWLNYLHVRKPLILAHGAKLCLRNRTHVYRSLAGIYFFIGRWMYIHIWVAVPGWPPPPLLKKSELAWIAYRDRIQFASRNCRPVSRVGFLLFLNEEIYSVTDSKASISWPCIYKLIYRGEKKMQIYVDT